MTGMHDGMKESAPGPQSEPRLPMALIVDDEPQVAAILRRMIARDVSAEVVHSCEAAMARLHEGQRYEVIICDLMMPGMTGMDLHAELTTCLPGQAACMIFMSGGAFTEESRSFLDGIHNPRIDKPFDLTMVRTALATVLERDAVPPA